jgi:chromosome segregation ATPase
MASKSATTAPLTIRGIVSKVSNDDDSELSPEPSQNEPPMPTQQPMNSFTEQPQWRNAQPWTPRHPNRQRCHDDGSLSTLPDVPSPYSPPPASLFSGEEWYQSTKLGTTERQPPSEVNLYKGNNNSKYESYRSISHADSLLSVGASAFDVIRNTYNNELSGQSPAAPMTHASHASSTTDRTLVLPTLMYLKTSLQESHQAQYLMRQENQSLALECERYQQEISKWQEHANEMRIEALQREELLNSKIDILNTTNKDLIEKNDGSKVATRTIEENFSKKLSELEENNKNLLLKLEEKEAKGIETTKILEQERQKNENLENQLLLSSANISCKDEKVKSISIQVDRLEQEVLDLKMKMKAQASENVKALKLGKEEHEEKLSLLMKEKSSAEIEVLRLQAMIVEAKQDTKRLMDERTTSDILREQIDSLNKELTKSQKHAGLLEEEVEILKKARDDDFAKVEKSNCELKEELMTSNSQLTLAIENARNLESRLEVLQKAHDECILASQSYQEKCSITRDETNRLQTELVQSLELNTELQAKIERLKQEDFRLKNELELIKSRCDEVEKQMTHATTATVESEAKCVQYEVENQKVKKELMDSIGECKQLQEHLVNTTSSLRNANEKITELDSQLSSLNESKEIRAIRNEVACQTDSQAMASNSFLDDSIFSDAEQNFLAGRFLRIKDNAERATLIKEYQQELSRVRNEYENDIKYLTTTHDHSLKEILLEAKKELKSRLQENKSNLHAAVEREVSSIRLRHTIEIDKVRIHFFAALVF